MIKTKLNEDLFDKIKENSRIVIFGAGEVGKKIFNDIRKEKPSVQILGFIDNFQKGLCLGLPIWSIKQFIDSKTNIDLVVMSTRTAYTVISNIFDVFGIPVLLQTIAVSDYYRGNKQILNAENYTKIENLFPKNEDKALFKLLFEARNTCDTDRINSYHLARYGNTNFLNFVSIKDHYLDKVNKDSIKIILDVGANSGLNVIAFNKLLPNLKKTYGFEVIYGIARKSFIEEFILNDKFELVPFALGDSEKSSRFFIDRNSSGGSFCADLSNRKITLDDTRWKEITINTTTMDKYCEKNKIRPDFIKMDIEGAELAALKGGLNTIKKYRPQLAISIYHSHEDFINIPLFLSENLEEYIFSIGHYTPRITETVLYAIPKELA